MVHYLHITFGLLILQMCVRAAPNNIANVEEPIVDEEVPEVDKLEETVEVLEDPKLDSQPLLIEESKHDDNSTQSLRQKRFYNFYGFGAPPINPLVYPSYNKRDQSAETGVYGLVDDPLDNIQKRLHDIASFVRQPAPPPPPPSHFPFFFPVIYIPQYECDCSSHNENPTPPQPVNPPTPNPGDNQKNPDPDKRFPDLSDDRLNWGIVNNDSKPQFDDVNEDEYARPISFVPLDPIQPMGRPAPPVEHGSSQGNVANTPQVTTTVRSTDTPRRPRPTARPPSSQERPIFSQGPSAPYPPSFSNDIPQTEQPSPCDVAVLSCCHRLRVTYDCFVAQGCLEPQYRSLCEPLAILQVIEKFQKFYGVRDKK